MYNTRGAATTVKGETIATTTQVENFINLCHLDTNELIIPHWNLFIKLYINFYLLNLIFLLTVLVLLLFKDILFYLFSSD